FIFGMVENGARGIGAARDVRVQRHGPFEDTAVDDPQSYGIDWETLDDPMLMAHHLDNNPDEWESTNPFSAGSNRPNELSVVECEAPNCPFSQAEIAALDAELALRVDNMSREMNVRRLLWVEALRICQQLYTN
ncbi:uncharacterized protein C8Q71DRAFT_694810, partial [Rhodofomes roseus]